MTGGAFIFGSAGRERVTVRDLSARGIGIEMARAPARNELLRVVVSLDGTSWIDLRGVVRHFRRTEQVYLCGIELSGSDAATLREVEAYVRRVRARVQVASRMQQSTETGRHRMVRDKTGKLRPVGSEPTPDEQPVSAGLPARKTPPPTPKAIPIREPGRARKDSAELRALYAKAVRDIDGKPKK